ncbi:MAG: hypothetical protein ACTSRK_02515 [Promethearchaeota archaeon]
MMDLGANLSTSEILTQLERYQVISIIGLEKNVGKTTTLNFLINLARTKYILGLTSIGRDGEAYDEVFGHAKPRIYVPHGTILATARTSLYRSDISLEILSSTHVSTPLGNIIIARALSAGYVELAGPSTTSDLRFICDLLQKFGSGIVFVDGAVNRKSFASPTVTQATIMATGAAVSSDYEIMISETEDAYRILSTPSILVENVLNLARVISKLGVITQNQEVVDFPVSTPLDVSDEIIAQIPNEPCYLVVNGVFSNDLLMKLFKSVDPDQKLVILVIDSTKIFLDSHSLNLLRKTHWELRTQNAITILFITTNPYSPLGYGFDPKQMLAELRKRIEIPVIDVIGDA